MPLPESRGAENALREHRRRGQRQARRQLPAALRVEKFARLAVEDVELKEVVGQRVVIYAVLGVEPLAVEDVAAAERRAQRALVGLRPARQEKGTWERSSSPGWRREPARCGVRGYFMMG